MKRTPESSNIVLDDFDPSSEWVVESQASTFDNEDLSWMDLDPLPQLEVQIPSRPGESSGIHNPPHVGSQSIHVDDSNEDSDE